MSIRPSSRLAPTGSAIAGVAIAVALARLVVGGPLTALADVTAESPPERIEEAIASGRLGVAEMAALADALVPRRAQAERAEQVVAFDRVLWLMHECGALPAEHAARWMRNRIDRAARVGEVKPTPFGERVTVPIVIEFPRLDLYPWAVASRASDQRGEAWPEPIRLFRGSFIPQRWEIDGLPAPRPGGSGVLGAEITSRDVRSETAFQPEFTLPPGRYEIALTVDFWACDRQPPDSADRADPADPRDPWPRERWSRRFETTVTVLPPDAARPVERSVWVAAQGGQRRYLLRVPRGQSIDRPLPLVVVFHGGGGDPTSMMRFSGLNETADQHGFLLAYPFGTGRMRERQLSFNAGDCCGHAVESDVDDIAFVSAMLDDIATILHVDTNRVYATGMSNGAMMAYRVAAELADRFAAIAPVAGPMGFDRAEPSQPVSVIHFHGTADEHAPYAGGEGAEHSVASDRRPFRSVEHAMRQWIAANGCDSDGVDEVLADGARDDLRVIRTTWGGGADGGEVVLVRVEGGGHTWPGRRPPLVKLGASTAVISANELMWEFFRRHARRGADGD